MDYRKVAILSAVAVLVFGGGAVGIIAWRASQLAAPGAEQPGGTDAPPGDGGLEPGGGLSTPGGSEAPDGGTSAPAETPSEPATVTTIDPDATDPGCDVSVDAFDCDYDNLTNAEERERKTDPRKDDTDGDGLLDGSELSVWKSDPLNPRSIDPSMTDLEAVNAGKRNTR